MQWIPSHCGVKGNEVADSLANIAHDKQDIDEYPIERREIEVLVNTAAQRQWKQRWEINRRNCALEQIKQELKDWNWCRIKNRQIDVAVTRLRTGLCKLRYYMHKIGLAENPECIKCNMNTEETITHFLIQCPSLSQQRSKLIRNLNIYGIVQITTDILLGGSNDEESVKEKINEELARFLKNSGRLEDI